MKIGLGQINSIVGNIDYNLNLIFDFCQKSYEEKCDLVIFPELSLSGYPPLDLLNYPWFINGISTAAEKLIKRSQAWKSTAILFGLPSRSEEDDGKSLINNSLLIQNGELKARVVKSLIPTYDVFDELRYFQPAEKSNKVNLKDRNIGILICEDSWETITDIFGHKLYSKNPMKRLYDQSVDFFINMSASPYYYGKWEERLYNFVRHYKEFDKPIFYVNSIGVNDELIFDGKSFIINKKGYAHLPGFQSGLGIYEDNSDQMGFIRFREKKHFFEREIQVIPFKPVPGNATALAFPFINEENIHDLYDALSFGIGDYIRKTNYSSKVCLGLSGGIDSACVASLTVEALGKENVLGITMPSVFSSSGSIDDSYALAHNLGIKIEKIPINPAYESFLNTLKPRFQETSFDVTEENLQARIRGIILMAFSNKFNYFLLNTGNKSETAVGYSTLYGDMCGGLSPIGDVYKVLVYRLSQYINREKVIIPISTLTKAPSAELRPDQKDQDTLPEYEILDQIIYLYIEKGMGFTDILNQGFDSSVVSGVLNKINRNEYKRKQAPLILKVSRKSFGRGRVFPINGQINI